MAIYTKTIGIHKDSATTEKRFRILLVLLSAQTYTKEGLRTKTYSFQLRLLCLLYFIRNRKETLCEKLKNLFDVIGIKKKKSKTLRRRANVNP